MHLSTSALKRGFGSAAIAATFFGGIPQVQAFDIPIPTLKKVEETQNQRPFSELSESGQRRFAIKQCKDNTALKQAGFEAYAECTAAVFEGDMGIVTGEGAAARAEKRAAAVKEGRSLVPSKKMAFDLSGGSKDESSKALRPNTAGTGKGGKKKGLQPKTLTAYQRKEQEKTDQFKNDPLFQKLNSKSKVGVLPIIN